MSITRLITSSIAPAEIARDRADSMPTADETRHDDDADEQRDACAGEQAREDVAAEFVEAERVRQAGGSSRSASSCAAGSNGVSHRPERARPARRRATIASADADHHSIPDPRIEQPVREIGHQVHRRHT